MYAAHNEDLLKFMSLHVPDALAHTGSEPFDSHLRGVQSILRYWGADRAVADAGLFHSIYGSEGFQGYKLPLEQRSTLRALIGDRAERLVFIFSMVDRESVDATIAGALLAIKSESGGDGGGSECDGQEKNGKTGEEEGEEGEEGKGGGGGGEEDAIINAYASNVSFKSRIELGAFRMDVGDAREYDDFILLSLADWLEQVEGAAGKPNAMVGWVKGEAWGYRRKAYALMAKYLGLRGWSQAPAMYNAVFSREKEETRHFHTPVTPPVSAAAKEARAVLAAWRSA